MIYKKHLGLWLSVCAVMLACSIHAQVLITPNFSGLTLSSANQGFDVRLVNTSPNTLEGFLIVRITENGSGGSLQLRSDLIQLEPGVIVSKSQITWDGGLAPDLNANSQFLVESAIGANNFCYRFVEAKSGRNLGTRCREIPINPLARPALIYPLNGQFINNSFPIFSWRPPMPVPAGGIRYHMTVTELHKGQSPLDAINANYPLLDRSGISATSFPYPMAGIPLEENKEYVWQVQASSNQQGVGETEVWKFTVPKATVPVNPDDETESYRGVKEKLDGSFYVFQNHVYLSFDNRHYQTELNFTICEKGNPNNTIDCPAMELVPGENNIKLEIGGQLSTNKLYVLEIKDQGKSHFLEFKKIANN